MKDMMIIDQKLAVMKIMPEEERLGDQKNSHNRG